MNNNEIFQEFWRSYQWSDPKPVSYRLYHDDRGCPLFYTMEDLPGKYVEVTPEQYAKASFGVCVHDGQLENVDPVKKVHKLVPTQSGTACHPKDVTIVVSSNLENRSWKKN